MSSLLLILFITFDGASSSRVNARSRAHNIETKPPSEELHIDVGFAPWKDGYGGFGATEDERERWFASKPGYKAIYPEYCNGQNYNGEQLEFTTDGWSCIHKPIGGMGIGAFPLAMASKQKKDRVSSIIRLAKWENGRYICCAGECRKAGSECGKEPVSIETATKTLVKSVNDMKTRSGKEFAVNVLEGCEEGDDDCEEVKEKGVLASVNLVMDSDALQFDSDTSSTPTVGGRLFLEELAEPLSLHASMMLTMLQEQRTVRNESLRILLCAHGTLVESSDEKDPELAEVPKERANVLTESLEKLANRIAIETRPAVGLAHGHVQHISVPFHQNMHSMSLLYKVYEPSLFKPECKASDLYAFLPDFDPTQLEDEGNTDVDVINEVVPTTEETETVDETDHSTPAPAPPPDDSEDEDIPWGFGETEE